ncbi:protein of unknown function [Micromonospora phaseoli]|uniref:DUF202 domain-containing protein n=1 Tax=Micromonospora phaseoli TaxID=1144548 RepID=A0A1H6RD22_9ACTN|nr:DUF202 domain-containing protein [Micromonospora phaseoli]PZW03315.1 uncharacterized protein DUF202 [Micromonospora phaseoli]GIJ78351.1 hypothetical protein Xph01_27830 [Micromonospora phaseoli]SEI51144.1 protein of unknown function [Micromonospora phaseoli]
MTASRDPGLQPERTRLAWRRTALAMTVVTMLTVRLALHGGPAELVSAALAILGWAAAVTLCWRRATGTGVSRTGGRILAVVGLTTAGFALLGIALVLRGL